MFYTELLLMTINYVFRVGRAYVFNPHPGSVHQTAEN